MVDYGLDIVEQTQNNTNWAPVVGHETLDFLSNSVPAESQVNIRNAAVSILTKGTPPTKENGQETGLVVGYVQSGKTMSFETVITLARDNSFQIVIVLAGTSNPLLTQSTRRIRSDLRLDDPQRTRRWRHFMNPSQDDTTRQAIRDVLDEWRDASIPVEYKKTVLVTVLKQHQRLEDLTNLIRTIDMQSVPVLIIDDEADQASLNNEAPQGQQSTTYRCLVNLKGSLPNHTYLQYTATPQAPLLINIIDSLSPNFVRVLEPGQGYVGGQEFFNGDNTYTRVIPPIDVPTRDNILTEPPQSLIEALRLFMVGATVGIYENHDTGNRSMMVHPSRGTAQHQEYYNWVRNVIEEWKRILSLSDTDIDRIQLIEDLHIAYDDLSRTTVNMPVFEDLIPRFLYAFRNTNILEVNARAGSTPQVDWRSTYGWILVGGQAMDRGFTIEGLTVTYMPRGIGVGNADTIQQRARFFGYKRKYLGFCRIYLEQGTLDAFQHYVEHEEYMRRQLQIFEANNRPLNEWKRAFILDNALRPCRNNVIEFDYIHGCFSDKWVSPNVVLDSDTVLQFNRELVNNFISKQTFENDEGHVERTEIQKHQICKGLLLRDVIAELLTGMRITGVTDSQRNTGLLIQLSCATENNPEEECTVINMSPAVRRRRGINEDGEITNLYQGAAPVTPIERRGVIYPGDRALHDEDNVTIQIHVINLTPKNENDTIIAEEVPVLAVWVPGRMARGWITQVQQEEA